MKLGCFIFLWCFSVVLYANDDTKQETLSRIRPVGNVSIQNSANSTSDPVKVVIKKEFGQQIYEQYCTVCHRDGLAGAPQFRNEHDWQSRLRNKKLADLVVSAIKGLNAMPTKGTCMKCNNDELKAAIIYMLPKS